MQNVIERVLVTREEIEKRCDELGKEISEAYKQDKEAPLLVALLKGSVPFLSELIKHIDLDIQFDFMNVSSYQGTQSVGDVKILKDLDISIKDRRILLVEDIVDTGRTLKKVTQLLRLSHYWISLSVEWWILKRIISALRFPMNLLSALGLITMSIIAASHTLGY